MPDDGYSSGARAAPLPPETPARKTLANACQAGIVAEIANQDLYDTTLLPSVVPVATSRASCSACAMPLKTTTCPRFSAALTEDDCGLRLENLENQPKTVEE